MTKDLCPVTPQGIGSRGGFCDLVALVEVGSSSNFGNFNVKLGPFLQHWVHLDPVDAGCWKASGPSVTSRKDNCTVGPCMCLCMGV